DRRDQTLGALLSKQLLEGQGQLALESLWALNLTQGLDEATALRALDHANPQVRLWTVRLLCDAKEVPPAISNRLAQLAQAESNIDVCCQLACSARRLSA